jgi:hypothetical protein
MTRYRAVAARMGRQQPQRPQFVRVTSFLGLRAGLADQPSPRRLCNVRRASRTRQVVDCLKRSHRGNSSGAACNPLAVNTERCAGLTGAAPISQVQDDRRPLDMMSRAGARPGKCGRHRAALLRQGRGHQLGSARHARSSELQPTMALVDSSLRPCQHGRKCGVVSSSSKASASETR